MGLLVLKFGGTSVANVHRIEHAATLVLREISRGHDVVVVVSAMAGMTNQLVGYAHELCAQQTTREHDVVLSAGEQITAGLFALCLKKMGVTARSFLGWQIPIWTDDQSTMAKIRQITVDDLYASLNEGKVPIVAGFQGVCESMRITTLGRGGSDTTAVALAATMKAERCDIYTDVDGVYTADPRIVPLAQRIRTISYGEIFEMASQGAKVLQARSVELAMKYRVPLRVVSSFVEGEGTSIIDSEPLEGSLVRGIAHSDQEILIRLSGLKDTQDAALLFSYLARERIACDMILHHTNSVSFTITCDVVERVLFILNQLSTDLGNPHMERTDDIAKISVVGIGLKGDFEVNQTLFDVLGQLNIPIQGMSTSEMKLCILVHKKHMVRAMTALHHAYHLDVAQRDCA